MKTGISVIIPTLNAKLYLHQAVNSIMYTHYSPLEIIIVDDGSSDGTIEICRSLVKRFSDHVRFFRHPGNVHRGAGCTRNVGVRNARYPYIAFLDADDMYLPNRFTLAPKILDDNPDIDLVVEWTKVLLEESGMARAGTVLRCVGIRPSYTSELFERAITNVSKTEPIAWGVGAMTIRRDAFQRVGGFSERAGPGEDLVLRLKLLSSAKILTGQESPVSIYRIHGENTSNYSIYPNQIKFDRFCEVFYWMKEKKISKNKVNLMKESVIESGFYVIYIYMKRKMILKIFLLVIRMIIISPNIIKKRRIWGCVYYAILCFINKLAKINNKIINND